MQKRDRMIKEVTGVTETKKQGPSSFFKAPEYSAQERRRAPFFRLFFCGVRWG